MRRDRSRRPESPDQAASCISARTSPPGGNPNIVNSTADSRSHRTGAEDPLWGTPLGSARTCGTCPTGRAPAFQAGVDGVRVPGAAPVRARLIGRPVGFGPTYRGSNPLPSAHAPVAQPAGGSALKRRTVCVRVAPGAPRPRGSVGRSARPSRGRPRIRVPSLASWRVRRRQGKRVANPSRATVASSTLAPSAASRRGRSGRGTSLITRR